MSFKPAKAKGFEIDFGKFVTSAGRRSDRVLQQLELFAFAALFLGDSVFPLWRADVVADGQAPTAGAQVVNGWNNDFAVNSRATLGANVMAPTPSGP